MSTAERIRGLLRPEILAGKAYHVPDSTGLVKLDAMENPYPLPETLRAGWLDVLSQVAINRYPDPSPAPLKALLGERLGLGPDMDILLGNGSDEIIQLLLIAIAAPGRLVMAPQPTFAMYPILAKHLGLRYMGVPQRPGFGLDRETWLAAIAEHQPALVFLDYPNNPSGALFDMGIMEAICAQAPGLVVVDEAYHAFSGSTFAGRLGRFDNLLLLRTLSKEGLAGLRLGFLAGRREWIDQLDKLRLPYNINVLTQASARFFLEHGAALADQAAAIVAERGRVFGRLRALDVEVTESAANFLLLRLPGRAEAVFRGLLDRGILIKAFTGSPELGDYVRVTIGLPEENDRFLAALEQLL